MLEKNKTRINTQHTTKWKKNCMVFVLLLFFSKAEMSRLQPLGFSLFKMHYWQHHLQPQSFIEGRDWSVRDDPRGYQNPQMTFPFLRLKAPCCFCLDLGHASPPPLPFFLFFPSLPPHFKPWEKKNEEKHTNQEAFSLHCVFQLDLNRRQSIQLSLTLPSLFFSHVLFVCVFFFS